MKADRLRLIHVAEGATAKRRQGRPRPRPSPNAASPQAKTARARTQDRTATYGRAATRGQGGEQPPSLKRHIDVPDVDAPGFPGVWKLTRRVSPSVRRARERIFPIVEFRCQSVAGLRAAAIRPHGRSSKRNYQSLVLRFKHRRVQGHRARRAASICVGRFVMVCVLMREAVRSRSQA